MVYTEDISYKNKTKYIPMVNSYKVAYGFCKPINSRLFAHNYSNSGLKKTRPN